MRRAAIAWTALLVCLSIAPALARERMFVGTNLGVSRYLSEDAGLTVFSMPRGAESVGLLFGPGLRVGFGLSEGNRQSVYVDTDLSVWAARGITPLSTIQLMGGYQGCFGRGATQPYLTGGFGFLMQNGDGQSVSTPVAGLGVGVRRVLTGGAVRAELRYDYQFEARDAAGELAMPALHVVGIELGFDLDL